MLSQLILWLLAFGLVASAPAASCPDYTSYAYSKHKPLSAGKYKLSYMRPKLACRTFSSSLIENAIVAMKSKIADPDLYRLFLNTFPNTLDTAIRYKGITDAGEDLTFIITGDIDAMWLRDSANQVQSYLPYLSASSSNNSLASVYRGVINLQARYLLINPYCNSFQPPPESGIPPGQNGFGKANTTPGYDTSKVWECKYEIDSLAAFLEVSSNYFNATQDSAFFSKFNWVAAVNQILQVADAMMTPQYGPNGQVLASPYSYQKASTTGTEVLVNNGKGSPVQSGTGLIRSAFRPSDDSTIYQFFIPGNMMLSRYLGSGADIARAIGEDDLAQQMSTLSSNLRAAIENYAVFNDAKYGDVYAYEIDGYGSANMMDDANIPSLLSAPFYGYLDVTDPVYQNTRSKILSADNPYFARGSVISAVGGPHIGPGYAWPMASIVRILTSSDDTEITDTLKELLSSTDGLGLIHESIYASNVDNWTRPWFSWANGLFGQMIIDLANRKPQILKQSFQ